MDGQLLRWDSIKRSSNWQVIDRGTNPPVLLSKKDSQPALLTFERRNLLAILKSHEQSGFVRVEREGREVQVIDFNTFGGSDRKIVVENRIVKPCTAMFLGALVLFGGLACWFGPIRAGRRNTPWLIFFFSTMHILLWASQCVGTYTDSRGYLESFRSFHEGKSATPHRVTPYFWGWWGVFRVKAWEDGLR